MSDKCTIGAVVNSTLYVAFSAYCERNNTTMSEVLRDFATYCAVADMPTYSLPESSGGLVKNQKVIDYFKTKTWNK